MMDIKPFSWEIFNKVPLIGIIRGVSLADVQQILPVYQQAGLTTLEITMNTAGVEDIIKYALEHYPELNIGAGTVCIKEDLNKALDFGAQFIVTPVVVKKVIKSCVKKGIPIFPGAFTPSEIYKAWSWGASMVKIYPATSLGAEYIKDLKAPMRQLKLLPTGGVNLENLISFKESGADGFGIGSQLFNKALIKEKNWPGLQAHFQKFMDKLATSSNQV